MIDIAPYQPGARADAFGFRTILVVDDVPEVCALFEALQRRLADLDVLLTTEVSGERALALVREQRFDLVISDYRLRDHDGVEILQAARETHPEGRRVLMTGYNEVDAPVGEVERAHVDAYLHKPLASNELVMVMRHMLVGSDELMAEYRAQARACEGAAQQAQAPGVPSAVVVPPVPFVLDLQAASAVRSRG